MKIIGKPSVRPINAGEYAQMENNNNEYRITCHITELLYAIYRTLRNGHISHNDEIVNNEKKKDNLHLRNINSKFYKALLSLYALSTVSISKNNFR